MAQTLAIASPAETVQPLPANDDQDASPRFVEAGLTFLSHTSQDPLVEDRTSEVVREGDYVEAAVPIHDARALVPAPTLERQGFALIRPDVPAPVHKEEAYLTANYYIDVERQIRIATGADRVIAFDHNIRSGDDKRREALGLSPPVRMVHNDYTDSSGLIRARQVLEAEQVPEAEIERLLAGRVAQVNLWRPLKPVRSAPLALADARSIDPEDLVATKLVTKTRTGEIYYLAKAPGQLWYSFPDMTPEEALLIKGYDSALDGRARFSPHTAYDDPRSPADAPTRESIEVRTFAFFAD